VNHLDDDAELYALGLTDRERDAEIEAHLAACGACRARVVAAESAAAALAATLPPMPAAAAAPRRVWWVSAAAAAAALVFAATTAFEASSAHAANAQLAMTGTALGAIASSHFQHTTLAADPGVIVKALYARDGAWLYVVAEHAPPGAHVVLGSGTAQRDLGALDGGAPATLFARSTGRLSQISVVSDRRTIAHGTPVY
jgi:hypothetical protein